MSDAPERIAVWPDFVGHPSMTGQWSANTHPDNAVAYVRADLSDALLREAVEVLADVGAAAFSIANDIQIGPDDEGRDIYEMALAIHATARATLAKLRAHFDGEKE